MIAYTVLVSFGMRTVSFLERLFSPGIGSYAANLTEVKTRMPNAKVLSEKQAIVASLTEKLQGAAAGIIVDYKGITVAEDTALRAECRKNEVDYAVVKNTLLRFAFNNVGLNELDEQLNGTTALAVASDPVAPARVRRRVVLDLDKAAYPESFVVPYTEAVFDRITLEIMRGCTRGCRFCQAGMLYRPVRERSLETLLKQADSLERSTGYEEISLSSLSSGDYTHLTELVCALTERYADKKVSVSLPSMRLDSIVKPSLEEAQKIRKSGLTLAPEAGTQRLRDVINKGVTEDDLVRAVTDAFESGWSTVKLYFMIGLPTETDEDLEGIGHLAQDVIGAYFSVPKNVRARGLRVTCSASSFVPKPFTPFQWFGQDTHDQIVEKQTKLRDILHKVKGVNFNYHESELSMLEACFARGDRRMGDVLYAAWKNGCLPSRYTDKKAK